MSKEGKEQQPTQEDLDYHKAFGEFIKEFKGESDRAAVIIGTAKLDYLLYQVLSKYLRPVSGNNDDLLEGDSPLATFSSRINICYRLGIIDAQFARALHLTRKIRNAFAHEVSGCKLDSGPHKDRIRELAAPFTRSPAFTDIKKIFIHDKTGATADFITILAMMILRLEIGIFRHVEPISGDAEYSIIPPDYESALMDNGKPKDKSEES